MTFFRLEDSRLININLIIIILPPDKRYGDNFYRLNMSDGRIVTLSDDEAHSLLRLITISSTHKPIEDFNVYTEKNNV
jgi:hypothetical protein